MLRLPPETKRQLEQRARKTRKKDENKRLCVILAKSEGMSHELIAQAHRISVETVYRYLAEYEKENKSDHDPKGGRDNSPKNYQVIFKKSPIFTLKIFENTLKKHTGLNTHAQV